MLTVMLDPRNNLYVDRPFGNGEEHDRVVEAGALLLVLNDWASDYRFSYIILADEDG